MLRQRLIFLPFRKLIEASNSGILIDAQFIFPETSNIFCGSTTGRVIVLAQRKLFIYGLLAVHSPEKIIHVTPTDVASPRLV